MKNEFRGIVSEMVFGQIERLNSYMKYNKVSHRKIYFNHTRIHASRNKRKILSVVSSIIDDGTFFNGKYSKICKKSIENFFDEGYCVLTASGHDSLCVALASFGINKSDEVIFPVNAYPTAFPIYLSGAQPVPCDVDRNGQLDPQDLIKKITKNTKVVVLVYMYGLIGQLDSIKNIIKKHSLCFIEDCAQSFGSMYRGDFAGTFSDVSCFSFYPTKNIGALGDGGALYAKDRSRYIYMRQAVSYGEKEKYKSLFVSGHSRLSEIQAGVLSIYLKTIKKDLKKRGLLAEYYQNKIKEMRLDGYIRILTSDPYSIPALHLFVVEAIKRDQLRLFLMSKGIDTMIHYPYLVHTIPAFSTRLQSRMQYPNAERLVQGIVSLPFHQYLTERDIDYIVENIHLFYHT